MKTDGAFSRAHRHHHARQGLVAAGEADQRIVGVAAHHGLDAVGNDLARQQREFHALVLHGDAVGDRDGAEFPRRAAGFGDAALGEFRLAGEAHVAGRHLPFRRHHADHRPGDRRAVQPHRPHEGAVGDPVEAVGRDARAQFAVGGPAGCRRSLSVRAVGHGWAPGVRRPTLPARSRRRYPPALARSARAAGPAAASLRPRSGQASAPRPGSIRGAARTEKA